MGRPTETKRSPLEVIAQVLNGLMLVLVALLFLGEMAWHLFGPVAYGVLAIVALVPVSALFVLSLGRNHRGALIAMLLPNALLALVVLPLALFVGVRSINVGAAEVLLVAVTPVLNVFIGGFRLAAMRRAPGSA